MTSWSKEEIKISDGTKVLAQMPVIVSASRSTDIPAFYADWFMERLKAGYVKWFNPFNGLPLYVGFKKTRCIVFWSKNPAPMLRKLQDDDVSPLEMLEQEKMNYYFQYTLNDYDNEKIEPIVPSVGERIKTFIELSKQIGHHAKDRIVWRFDPLILTDMLTPRILLDRIERIGDQLAPYTSRLVFSFIDIKAYSKVGKNLERGGITAREFKSDEMLEVAEGIARLTKGWGMAAGTCGEIVDLDKYGIEHNRCVDDRLMIRCFSHDNALMDFLGYDPQGELFDLRSDVEMSVEEQKRHTKLKDKGQRLACGCIMSKDIGEYNTCPHLCHYCYANTNNAAAKANWNQHLACPHAETITGR